MLRKCMHVCEHETNCAVYSERGLGCALIKSTLGSGNPGRFGNLGGERTREQQGTKGTVYEQPGTEVDDSCHSWRVPSKWKQE